jgi:hypothetical protein
VRRVMGVMSSADPAYRIANASQFASRSSPVVRSTEESCAGWFEVSIALSATHWPGGGAGGPCVTPPSANAVAEMDAMSRQEPKNRVSFDIFWFPFDDALVGNHSQRALDCTDSRG